MPLTVCAEHVPSRADGSQSARGAELGRRDGGDVDRASASPANSIAAFSIVERVFKNVKRWHGGDQRERWVGSGLLVAEKQFRRITGHKQIPALIKELEALTPSKSAVVKRRKAS